jgi:FkbM family methyltransferase
MDIKQLKTNILLALRYRKNYSDALKRLFWVYAHRVPSFLRKEKVTICFNYPTPVGSLHLAVRTNSGSDVFIHSEVFEHLYYKLPLKSMPKTILDLGANIGFTAIYFSRCFPKAEIVCVEPEPNNADVLMRNLALNHVNAEVIRAAVSTVDGEATLQLSNNDYGHKLLKPNEQFIGESITVPTFSVTTILDTLGWESVDLVKIDIEGYERQLFSDDCKWLYGVQALCIEWHYESAEAELKRLASRFGFLDPIKLTGTWFMTRNSSQ